jgi:ribosomal protein S6--L-glutamate ligase
MFDGLSARGGGPGRLRGSTTIVVVSERRYLAQAQPAGLVAALERRGGIAARLVDADGCALRMDDAPDWLAGADLVVVRGRSTATLTLAAHAEASGVPTVNACAATERVRDKAAMAIALTRAGVPCPSTLIGSPAALEAELGPDDFPLILKPVFGDNSEGLVLVDCHEHLRAVAWHDGVAIAQHFLPSDGLDLKLYVIGDRVFAVRKPSPFLTTRTQDEARSVPAPVTPALRELALRCGRLFGLELFGVDCIEGPDGPLVIEVNEFPNYTGVPGADDLLADHVLSLAAHATVAAAGARAVP